MFKNKYFNGLFICNNAKMAEFVGKSWNDDVYFDSNYRKFVVAIRTKSRLLSAKAQQRILFGLLNMFEKVAMKRSPEYNTI